MINHMYSNQCQIHFTGREVCAVHSWEWENGKMRLKHDNVIDNKI